MKRDFYIQGQCIAKSNCIEFERRGESRNGKRFSFELKDHTGTIKVFDFDETAEELEKIIAVGQQYNIRNTRVRLIPKKYVTSSMKFELIFDATRSKVDEVPADDQEVIEPYLFTPLRDLDTVLDGAKRTVIAVVTEIGSVEEVRRGNTDQQVLRRTAELTDASNDPVYMTLWGPNTKRYFQEEDQFQYPIVLLHKMTKGSYEGYPVLKFNAETFFVKEPKELMQYVLLRSWINSMLDCPEHSQ